MQEASGRSDRSKTTRMELIRKNAQVSCIEGYNGRWLACAKEVLQNNQVHSVAFAAVMRDLLIKGRGKFRNIMFVGPANCDKTFLLSPLQLIYKIFSNPANDKYAWLGKYLCSIDESRRPIKKKCRLLQNVFSTWYSWESCEQVTVPT